MPKKHDDPKPKPEPIVEAEPEPEEAAPEPETIEPPAPATPIDTTIPGGRYLVDGVEVDANGEPIKGKKK